MSSSKLLCASCDYSTKWKIGRQQDLIDATCDLFHHCLRNHSTLPEVDKLSWNDTDNGNLWNLSNGGHIYVCDTCHQQFSKKVNVTRHLWMQHLLNDAEAKRFVCDQCGHSSNRNANLIRHIWSQHFYIGHGRLVCGACENGFMTKFSLMRHMKNVHQRTGDFVI